ncbi:MAG: hypothetical protein RLZZ67_470 [Candidatus Parcubacteria bacterium]|jgi:hypothetical protein
MSSSLSFPRNGETHPVFLDVCAQLHDTRFQLHELDSLWHWCFDHFHTMSEIRPNFSLAFKDEDKVDIRYSVTSFYNIAFTLSATATRHITPEYALRMISMMPPDLKTDEKEVCNLFLNTMIQAQRAHLTLHPQMLCA